MSKTSISLAEVTFGKPDAESEVSLGPYCQNVYCDPFNAERKIQTGSFLIMGRKGTGKSALAYNILRGAGPNRFVQRLEYSMKDIEQVIQTPGVKDLSAETSKALWEWIILCNIVKFVISDESINLSQNRREEFDRFNKINRGFCSPGSLELRQQVESEKLEIKIAALNRILESSGHSQVEATSGKAHFLRIIEPLRELLKETLESTLRDKENEYFVVIDNLDIGYRGTEPQKEALIGLLRAAKSAYSFFHFSGVKFYPIILIRPDMMADLEYEADTNRLVTSNGLRLNWYDHDHYIGDERNVPLRTLISSRVEESYRQKGIEIRDGWDELFQEWSHEKPSFKYIIDKTLYRPRDLIQKFNLLQEQYPKSPNITKEMVDSVSKKFAAYMIGEWRNELAAHFEQAYIGSLFSSLNKSSLSGRFSLESFMHINELGEDEALEKVDTAFEFGLICAHPNPNKMVWSHRPSPDLESLDYNGETEFGLHSALAQHFGHNRPKRRFW